MNGTKRQPNKVVYIGNPLRGVFVVGGFVVSFLTFIPTIRVRIPVNFSFELNWNPWHKAFDFWPKNDFLDHKILCDLSTISTLSIILAQNKLESNPGFGSDSSSQSDATNAPASNTIF